MPCSVSSAITFSIEGGFRPRGGGWEGLLNASLIAASRRSLNRSSFIVSGPSPGSISMSTSKGWPDWQQRSESSKLSEEIEDAAVETGVPFTTGATGTLIMSG